MLTKNCDPPELGPALAMLSVPGSFEILCVCSSGIEPVPSRSFWPCPGTSYGVLGFGPPVPHLSRAANQARGDAWPEGIDLLPYPGWRGFLALGHPNCSMKSLITRWK